MRVIELSGYLTSNDLTQGKASGPQIFKADDLIIWCDLFITSPCEKCLSSETLPSESG